MSVAAYPNLFVLTVGNERVGPRFGAMFAVSLVLHFLLFLLAIGLRFPVKVERPLSSYEVSLVAMPTPQRMETSQVTPTKEPQPVARVTPPVSSSALKKIELTQAKPAPAPVVPKLPIVKTKEPLPVLPPVIQAPVKATETKSISVPAHPVRIPTQPVPVRTIKVPEYTPLHLPSSSARKILDRDMLRGVPLPPDVPKLSEVSPESTVTALKETNDPTPTQKDIRKLLGSLQVPDPSSHPIVKAQKEKPQPGNPTPMRSSVTAELDELNKRNERLQNEYKQMERVEPPRQIAQARPLISNPPPPQMTKTSLRNPMTKIQAVSSGPGSNRYLQIVQQLISRQWQPHQVDPTIESFQVVVKFRLYRNGNIQDVVVEQTSGNGYFDDAGKRAVLRALPLPAFPSEMTDQYLDAHFSFLVGEQTS